MSTYYSSRGNYLRAGHLRVQLIESKQLVLTQIANKKAKFYTSYNITLRGTFNSFSGFGLWVSSVPEVGKITVDSIGPIPINTTATASASFIDPVVYETHTATWDWGDGSPAEAGTLQETDGSGTVTGLHTYTQVGVYTVTLTITDESENEGISIYEYVVVHDPVSFVTGGGWIDSPENAYADDPLLTGKANFGFVSKYKKGATVPIGVTEFKFKVANLNFHSDTYQWLVVAGARAQYKGTGTINGTGDYGFMLTAIDGGLPGGGGADKFRIKIWDNNNDATVIYDNQLGEGDTADPTTLVQGGSIIIHKEK